MNINFITNQSIDVVSGGWSGISYNVYRQLQKQNNVNYIGPINPQVRVIDKTVSKIRRSVGLKSNFTFFSQSRLDEINRLVSDKIIPSQYNFFFGQNPWTHCYLDKPYGVYMDADFKTYLSIYSNPLKFRKKDIERIAKEEEEWLQNASHIFMGSQWAWNQMIKNYKLDENKKIVVHTGGNIAMPEKDSYKGGLSFVFISLNFLKKGGILCTEVFKKIKSIYNNATLTIIGEHPPKKYLNIPGVKYEGLLNKNNPEHFAKFQSILREAFLLIHPTVMDTMGAVIIEAGYYGCPAIAPNSFGIPELIKHNQTGIITDVPFNIQDFYTPIENLIENKNTYTSLRKNVWEYCRSSLTWDAIGNKLNQNIHKSIE